jgi:uncharacterized protein
VNAFPVQLRFHGGLRFFVSHAEIARQLREKTSVKDAIEACGVPHPEVGVILCEGAAVDFRHQLDRAAVVDVYPADDPSVKCTRFIADGHLGKLTRDLRLLGIDVEYTRDADDHELVRRSAAEERALLSRDRRLLMHAAVHHGYFPRSQVPAEQTLEVIRRFRLTSVLQPFTRCLPCNGLLEQVEKSAVLDQLEPLTKRYYEAFRRCTRCGQIFWSGSHFTRLQRRVAQLRTRLVEAD